MNPFILVLKPPKQPPYAQAFDSIEATNCHGATILARLDSPADVENYLTRHAFGGPVKAYGHVERSARSLGWIEPDTKPSNGLLFN